MKICPRASGRIGRITAGGDFHPALRVLVCFNVLTAGVKGRGRKFPRFGRVAGRRGRFFGGNTGRGEGQMRAFLRGEPGGECACGAGKGGARKPGRGEEKRKRGNAPATGPHFVQCRFPCSRACPWNVAGKSLRVSSLVGPGPPHVGMPCPRPRGKPRSRKMLARTGKKGYIVLPT